MYLPKLLDAVKAVVVATVPSGENAVIRRRYLPDDEKKSLGPLTIDVAPAGVELEQATRSESEEQQSITIGFRQNLPANVNPSEESGNTWFDARLQLIADVLDAVDAEDFDGGVNGPRASLIEIGNRPQYDVKSLREDRIFLSIIQLTFTRIE